MSSGDSIPTPSPSPGRRTGALRTKRPLLILAIAGANLTLIQFVAIKEFASLLGSNELVVLIVLAGYFLGLSIGYLFSERLQPRTLLALGAVTLALHATLPFSARWFAGLMGAINLGGNILPFVFLLTMFGITPFYAVFLPRLIDEATPGEADDDGRSLVRLYATEIAGGLGGLLIVVAATPARIALILALHLAGLVALILLYTSARPRTLLALCALPPLYLILWDPLDRASLAFYYQYARQYKAVSVIASEFSPYQRVDLIKTGTGGNTTTQLFLNGNLLYGTRFLHQHNLIVSILPNLVVRHAPANALVIGGGSLDTARYLSPLTRNLHIVEIDETVARLTRKYIQEPRGHFPEKWDLSIDDGKHFLGNWTGEPFDTISIDIPVPTHLQTAMLHSDRFFALAHSRLKPDGIFSISLAGTLKQHSPDSDGLFSGLSNRIVAGLLRNFKHVMVLRIDQDDYAWASDEGLPANGAAIQERVDEFLGQEPERRGIFGTPRIGLLDEGTIKQRAEGFAPIGEADMQVVLRLSLGKLYYRFYEPK